MIHYTDRREYLLEMLEKTRQGVLDGHVEAIALVQLTSDGEFHCKESYKNNSDRLALLGATQVLAQHIMAGE